MEAATNTAEYISDLGVEPWQQRNFDADQAQFEKFIPDDAQTDFYMSMADKIENADNFADSLMGEGWRNLKTDDVEPMGSLLTSFAETKDAEILHQLIKHIHHQRDHIIKHKNSVNAPILQVEPPEPMELASKRIISIEPKWAEEAMSAELPVEEADSEDEEIFNQHMPATPSETASFHSGHRQAARMLNVTPVKGKKGKRTSVSYNGTWEPVPERAPPLQQVRDNFTDDISVTTYAKSSLTEGSHPADLQSIRSQYAGPSLHSFGAQASPSLRSFGAQVGAQASPSLHSFGAQASPSLRSFGAQYPSNRSDADSIIYAAAPKKTFPKFETGYNKEVHHFKSIENRLKNIEGHVGVRTLQPGLPKTIYVGGRREIHIPEPSMKDRQRLFEKAARASRPLATKHGSRKNLGSFVVIERSGTRFHIEVEPDMPEPSITRLVNLLFVHSKKLPDAILNQYIDGKEQSWGAIKALSKAKLRSIIKRIRQKATFIVVSPTGGSLGALGSPFWTHHSLARILSRR